MRLERGVIKACAGIVESAATEPYVSAVRQAELVIGQSYLPEAEEERQRLVDAIKLNLTNRNEYPIIAVIRWYDLPVSERTFKREKHRYCVELARLLGLVRKENER